MANRKSHSASSRQNKNSNQDSRIRAKKRLRHMLHETLEERQLLTVGPQLIGIQPDSNNLLFNGDVLNEAPRELTFRFDDSQQIDPATLAGIQITAAGGDGSFGVASAQSDFGSQGKANILLTAANEDLQFTVNVDTALLAPNAPPVVASGGSTIAITLNTNPAGPTTADQLIDTLNTVLAGSVTAELNGGVGDAPLGLASTASFAPFALDSSSDRVVSPGAVLVGDNPDQNEVTVRFAETLKDDRYKIDIFGFDDPTAGIVGLKNTAGEFFVPSASNSRAESVEFRLDLGSQVISVVPQPVVRVGGQLQQLRDTVVVYFDSDKLDAASVETPDFYQLIYTNDTVQNFDDHVENPTSVTYNAANNTATLKFRTDIDNLAGGSAGSSAFRLRIGSRESTQLRPTRSEAAANVITDLNTDGQVQLRFTAREIGEAGNGIQVVFTNSQSGTAEVTASGRTVTIDLGRDDLTAAELVDLLRTSSAASALVSVDVEPGSDTTTVVGNTNLSFSPLTLLGVGSTFDTSTNLGVIGSSDQLQTSLILSSTIDAQQFELDLPGASNDPGHRQLPQNSGSFEDHVNEDFGADSTDGITTIYYNFQDEYATSPSGDALGNSITDAQKQRAREVLSLWSKDVGVQFVETANLGVTIATGQLNGLTTLPGTRVQTEVNLGFGVRVDPEFQDSLVIMSASTTWIEEYGDNYTRRLAAAMGMILGLEHAGDLPETTLLRLDPTFLSGSGSLIDGNNNQLNASDELYEPVFPGNQDVLHAQYLHRPDSTDVDLFRFEVALDEADQVGLLTAETFAQRLPNSSALNTNIELFRQTQATASTNLGAGNQLQLEFEAVADGALGNQLQISFTQTDRLDTSAPRLSVFANAISIDLNSNPAFLTTVQQVVDVLTNSSAARRLVNVNLASGDPNLAIGNNVLTQNPVVLSGGKVELVAQNDDYFSDDSYLKQSLSSGVYYIGVSAAGSDANVGGQSQGDYELRIEFRAQVDVNDTIRDLASGDTALALDGDGDGTPGGAHNFWFETRPLNRSLSFTADATPELDGRFVRLVGGNGIIREFEFSTDPFVGVGRIPVPFADGLTPGDLSTNLANAINSRPELGVTAFSNGATITLIGERSIELDSQITTIDIHGKTIFVDKAAAVLGASGTLLNPFNNIAGNGVPNAFGATHPGDIVRIVGNGGVDGDISTVDDNLAYEIGVGVLPGSTLSDGISMDVPKGVTATVDAGAIFKMRQAAINVGSTNLGVDRSGAAFQVLGAPVLLDADGNTVRNADGSAASGVVRFTSWLDESTGFDTFAPTTTPSPGDWGGISFQRDVDLAAGRTDLEDEGIFLQYVNHADIRYGGGTVLVDSVQRTVNSIQMLDTRPTVTDNVIMMGADAAMSALPNSFEETTFHEPRFQADGAFTSDYDRVGPDIKRNTLINNSLNGLFIRVDTAANGLPQTLEVSGRFDDTDIVHLITENVVVSGNPGGAILDSEAPDVASVSTAPTVGGRVLPAIYTYKLTFVDRFGYESVPSDPTFAIDLPVTNDAIQLAGLPSATGDYVTRKLYRSAPGGAGPYKLVALLDSSTSTYVDTLSDFELAGELARDRAEVSGVVSSEIAASGTLDGTYNYRIVMIDSAGRDSLASNPTSSITVAADSAIQLDQLPLTLNGFIGRRIYRSQADGSGPFVLVGELLNATDSTTTSFQDSGAVIGGELSVDSFGVRRPRPNASLVIDPGTVLKLEAARIEATFGATIIAEGDAGKPIVFTSKLDDSVGAGGTFDTNNNGTANGPAPRDWGGIYMAPTSSLSVDHARFTYGGGVTKIDGTFRAFNTIEIQQADARIANSVFKDNADGFGGQGPGTRFGRLSNAQSTIFVRGSQPTIIGNTFIGNAGSPIEIDVLSIDDKIRGDQGRQTGPADQNPEYVANRGPLIRGNRFANNDLNGLEIRAGEILTQASVWDDTDIVHVVTEEILVGNVQHEGGLRLQSSADESLVVKFDGYGSNFNRYLGAGLTAFGETGTSKDRIGGSLHVVGQPDFPVILTSLADDTVGAGLRPDGSPQTDTNNDGIGSVPQSADWRGLLLDQYSNDRNVQLVLEEESLTQSAPGPNGFVSSAQLLGTLAANASESNENRQLGFVVEGALSQDADIDVFSFSGVAGTEVWLDVDYTNNDLDLVLELLDANGSLLARSDNSTAEEADPSLIFVTNLIEPTSVNPLSVGAPELTAAGAVKEDGTTNPKDPGLRVRLPGATGSRSTYYFRVRSAGLDIDNTAAGLSSGPYQVQVRMREAQEFASSTINFADIRYATNGVHLRGLPGTSPLIGEAAEDESSATGTGQEFAYNGVAGGDGITQVVSSFASIGRQKGNRPQYLGNILDTDKGGFSVAGEISSFNDVDFYRVDVSQEDIIGSVGNGFAPVVFDLDYADGYERPDTNISIFIEEPSSSPLGGNQYRLIYAGSASNIADDIASPLATTDAFDLSRGSAGTKDGYIGPVALAEGTYIVGITSAAMESRAKLLSPFGVEPLPSIEKIVDTQFVEGVTSAVAPRVPDFAFQDDGAGGLLSSTFDLAGYVAEDLPTLYLQSRGAMEVWVRDAAGNEVFLTNTANGNDENQISLSAFAGQSGLQVVLRNATPGEVGRVIVGFAERGEQFGTTTEDMLLTFAFIGQNQTERTREFTLETYSATFDQPGINFDYQVVQGVLDVFVEDQFGIRTRIATSDQQTVGFGETLLVAQAPTPLNVTIDISAWAGQPDVEILFVGRDNNPTAITVRNVHVQLADGSRVHAGETNSTFATINPPPGAIIQGKYQLEVRLAETFFESTDFGNPILTKAWDTNDRLAEQASFVAPSGGDLSDGDQFSISDGLETVVFEFNSAGGFGLGNTPINFTSSDTAAEIAQKIRESINSSGIQSRLAVEAGSAGGVATGQAGDDATIHLHGNATVTNLSFADAAGELQITNFTGSSDRNIVRDQSQVIIQNSFIREPRDYGIWSEPAARLQDPRDFEFGIERTVIQDAPPLAGTQAVRNLPTLNDDVQGGLLPGLTIENNILEEGGLGGINLQGESPIWMISPAFLDPTDNDPFTPATPKFGRQLRDGDFLVIDSDRTRLHFEFEDIATTVEGDGYREDSVPVYYREDGGNLYHRIPLSPPFAPIFGTNGLETLHSLRDSILGSIFVTNDSTQQVRATIAGSLLGPDPNAPPTSASFGYPEYYNRPALYLEGVTNIQMIGANPFDIRPLDLGDTPQPHARIVNNTIIGKDGRASFNGETALNEDNDTIADAVQTWQGTSHNPLLYSDVGIIGDGGPPLAGRFQDPSAGNGGGGSVGGNSGGGNTAFNADQLIVGYQPGMTEAQKTAFLSANGLELIRDFAFIDAMLVGFNDGEVLNRSEQLAALPEVRYAEPDYLMEFDAIPNDPQFGEQWHFDNQGQTGGRVDADIDLPEAWDTFRGSEEVVIAVLDSGVDHQHPDLIANMWVNPGEIPGDGIDNDNNGYIDDIHGIDPGSGDSDPMDTVGHGTHVAGTTGAVTNNGAGVAGVNWNSKIMALKIGADFAGPSIAAAIEALDYIVTMKTQYGINIVVSNNSYGGGAPSQAMQDAIQRNIDVNVPFVASAGNSGTDNDALPHYPDGYDLDGIISVAATDHNDQLAGFSQFGATTVDVAAPGVDVLSTTLGGGYGLNSGTSMASPHVAGVVALLAGAAPGASVGALKSAIMLGADPLQNLSGTNVSGARLNAATSLLLINSGLAGQLSTTDVDIYQFKLGVGERAIIDIDTADSGLDPVLQIFDSSGIAQTFTDASGVAKTISDNDAAPGETLGVDPYADFTATAPGVYFAAVSAAGNQSYDPLSLANRQRGETTGPYRITISARHLQDFVITAQDASAYNAGDTFTIFGVPDVESTGSAGRTFEFVFGIGGPSDPNNIPINLNADWRVPDVARAIAKAINEGDGGDRAIPNTQFLDNGEFGIASPLPPVHAVALGGLSGVIDAPFNDIVGDRALFLDQFVDNDVNLVSGFGFTHLPDREIERLISGPFDQINQGLELFTRRLDGVLITTTTTINNNDPITRTTSMGNLGIGHDRDSTNPLSPTSVGDGTTEKFIKVRNAAYIDGNGVIRVDPDEDENNNLDQLLPETGVLATRGASPTLLNNVFFNLQTPVIAEESRRFPLTGGPAPYGTDNPNAVLKPGEVILGGSSFQYHEPGIAEVRFGTGIEQGPTNVPNTALDLNFEIAAGVQLFENAQAGNYLPSANSPLIDSSVDTLPERPSLQAVKNAVGIPSSPVIAPAYDLVGQLRVDDPDVAPPSGQGQNVFKDRGALDRADFVGPAAILSDPVDNDSLGVDQDQSVSVVQLESGVYPEFRIQLQDGNEPSNPFRGLGIDDSTVVNSIIEGLRDPGAVLVIFENGRLLQEGIDYTFDYNPTRDEIVLTPLAGVWKNDVVYEISINNKNRFAVVAPAGDQVSDGDVFTISDADGGQLAFEFDSGYRLQVPQGLELHVPIAGGGFGGIADGDRFSIVIAGVTTTFEFDRNGNTLGTNLPIAFTPQDSQGDVTDSIIAAIQSAGLEVTPVRESDGEIFIGAAAGVRLDTTFSSIDQPATTLALKIPELGPRPGGVTDGQRFTISDGRFSVTFEYDLDNSVSPGTTAIDFSAAATVNDLAVITQEAIAASPLALVPTVVADDLIHIGLSVNGSASTDTSALELLGVARTPMDGESFTISGNGNTAVFEFDSDNSVAAGNVAITVSNADNQTAIADRIAAAVEGANLGFTPLSVGDGNIALGGTPDDTVDTSSSPSLSLFGRPGVRSNTRLEIFGPLVLQVPPGGAGDIQDNDTFAITANGQTVTFEFDSDFSGPTLPGNVIIPFSALNTVNDIADAMVTAIAGSGLGIITSNLGGGRVRVGNLASDQVDLQTSPLTTSRGVIADGETFVIDNGTEAITFEFEDVDIGNGFSLANTPILFSFSNSTIDDLTQAMKAAIEGSSLGLTTTILPGGILELNATPLFAINTAGSPSLLQSGVPGGSQAVPFIQDPSFDGRQMKLSILEAINSASNTPLVAADRGGSTFFVENAVSISPEIQSFFLRGVADLAGNLLKPNRIDDQTAFTILMPGVELDYGDAPDPLAATQGRYATQHVNDGARHVIVNPTEGGFGTSTLPVWLGSTIDAEVDGQPTAAADGDNDDGVVFGTNFNIPALFNRNVETSIDVTVSNPGFVDGWIDFNADGDWDDPGEHILDSVRFGQANLSQTFMVTVPATAPELSGATTTFARFRSSSSGGLIPTGLAVDGEVEDYAVTIVPGSPPTAVNDDFYVLNEDSLIVTTDPTGGSTPGFTIDDGIAANDTDPDGDILSVELVDPPAVGVLSLAQDGTFTYRPPADFNGEVTFTYRVNDGVLNSNNIGTVTITVAEVNDPPIAADDSLTVNEDEVLTIDEATLLANDVPGANANESSQTLTVTSVDSISQNGGTLQLVNGQVIYTPPSNYSGPDQFVYTVTDNGTTDGAAAPLSASATVSLTVLDLNDPPITVPVSDTTPEDTALTLTVAQLMDGDVVGPPDEIPLQQLLFAGVDAASANGGTVVLDGTNVIYTPPADFVGTDTFIYRVQDNGESAGLSDPKIGLGTVSISVTPINDEPRVSNPFGEITMLEDDPTRIIDLTTVFFDPDVTTNSDALTFTVIANNNDTLVNPVINGSQLELQLLADQNGQALVEVQAQDLAGASTSSTLTLNVTPVNDAPRLTQPIPDQTVAEDSAPLQLTLTDYFSDPDVALNGDVLTFEVLANSNPLLVTPEISGDTLTLNLSANQSGVAVMTIRVTDASGAEQTDTFSLVVTPENDAPIGVDDTYTVGQGQTLTTTDPRGLVGGPEDNGVLANDTDPEGDTITAQLVTGPQFASLFTLNSDGTFTYRHDFARGRETDTFTYIASDGVAQSSAITVTINIGDPPPPPHQNPVENMDVNADGFISPIDALLVVNFLNTNTGDGSVAGLPAPPPFRDVNGDNFITPIDALLVINFLNNGEGEGEGEAAGGIEEAFGYQEVIMGSSDNQKIGMRTLELEGGAVYGPVRQSPTAQIFGDIGSSDASPIADTSWVDETAASDDEPIDLAIASLLGDLDDDETV